jgi:hypothetical protein
MAEEIALHLVLDAAAGIVADETPELELFTGGIWLLEQRTPVKIAADRRGHPWDSHLHH